VLNQSYKIGISALLLNLTAVMQSMGTSTLNLLNLLNICIILYSLNINLFLTPCSEKKTYCKKILTLLKSYIKINKLRCFAYLSYFRTGIQGLRCHEYRQALKIVRKGTVGIV